MNCFLEPYTCSKKKVALDFSNYATKSDLKIATDVNTSKFTKKADLASLNQM